MEITTVLTGRVGHSEIQDIRRYLSSGFKGGRRPSSVAVDPKAFDKLAAAALRRLKAAHDRENKRRKKAKEDEVLFQPPKTWSVDGVALVRLHESLVQS